MYDLNWCFFYYVRKVSLTTYQLMQGYFPMHQ